MPRTTTPWEAAAPVGKRILMGVCGVGNGHASQAQHVISTLLQQGHQVAVITFNDGLAALKRRFPHGVSFLVPTHFPGIWVEMGTHGMDLAASAANSQALDPQGDAWSFVLCEQVIEALGGEPDLVLTDYEPASAQIAYLLGRPLITTELHGKFLIYQTPDVGRFTRMSEAAKLRYFFPAADQRISSSFFPMEWERDERYPGEVLEPILRPDVRELTPETDDSSVLVYISPYGPMRQRPEELVGILAGFPETRFRAFSKEPIPHAPGNVDVASFDREIFTSALATCSGVISTAGHSLLSECLYLGKPVLGIPFDIYEQRFNAMMLEHHGIGMRTDELTPGLVGAFLPRRQEFAEQAGALAKRVFTGDSADLVGRLGL